MALEENVVAQQTYNTQHPLTSIMQRRGLNWGIGLNSTTKLQDCPVRVMTVYSNAWVSTTSSYLRGIRKIYIHKSVGEVDLFSQVANPASIIDSKMSQQRL